MQITKPTFYKEFSCIAGACPDTCCAGWQIMIDEKASRNTVDSKVLFETDFTMTSTGKNILSVSMTNAVHFWMKTISAISTAKPVKICYATPAENIHVTLKNLKGCVNTPCPSPARKPREFLSHKEKITFFTREVAAPEETFDDFDYFLLPLWWIPEIIFSPWFRIAQYRSDYAVRNFWHVRMISSSVWSKMSCSSGKISAVGIKNPDMARNFWIRSRNGITIVW